MSDQSPVLGLPYILPAQAQKHVTHNMAIQQLDALVQLHVASADIPAPPLSPATGERYIVAAAATGDWLGQEDSIATWQGSAWGFTTAVAGWQTHVLDQNATLVFDGASWQPEALDLQNLAGIGINTTSDTTNRLAVSADATLLSHDGAGHQIKVNKAAPGDTASLLFQSNYSGRVEMGLAGDDDFHLKVSSDGSSFVEAQKIKTSTGHTHIKCLLSGQITIANDTVGYVDTPSAGGFVFVSLVNDTYPQSYHSGILVYDTGGSLSLVPLFLGGNFESHGSAVLTGTTSTAGNSGMSTQSGQLQIENRFGYSATYAYTFIGGL